jgi:hypothetical protein
MVPADLAGAGPTLREYRADLGETLGLYQHIMVTSISASGEAARLISAEELRDDEEQPLQFVGAYAYAVDGLQAGQQRRVLKQRFDDPFDTLMLARPFAAPLAVGTSVEVTWPLPVKKLSAVKGLNDIVNEALDRCRVVGRLPLVGDDTRSFNLAATPFISSEEDTNGIYDWQSTMQTTDPPALSPHGYSLRVDGRTVSLQTDYRYASGDPFELAVFTTGKNLIGQNGIWGYSTTGLVHDDDQGAVPLYWVRAFGMVKAIDHLLLLARRDPALMTDQQQAEWLATRARWLATAAKIVVDEFPTPNPKSAASAAALTVWTSNAPCAPGYPYPPYPRGSTVPVSD